jgi:SAM-dependent MidA family methyltransferase
MNPPVSPSDPGVQTELHRRIQADILEAGGAIPFERFMGLALYEPGLGYYERNPDNVGKKGDFYTSVSVGPLFGELLAFHLLPTLESLVRTGPVEIVEAGAHDGRLTADLLGALDRFSPTLSGAVTARIVEPSPIRRRWQESRLAPFTDRIRWSEGLPRRFRGILVCNELLDAFPVERWRWRSTTGRWTKQGVAAGVRGFHWVDLPDPAPEGWIPEPALAAVLPDGFARERCPAAAIWWTRAAEALEEGHLLTCDYGHADASLPDPTRPEGTLRGYRKHRHVEDPLADAGEVDLTAHVDFAEVRRAGEAAGLSTLHDGAQSGFLVGVMQETLAAPDRFGGWDAARVRAFQTLTHPQHLGRAFRTLEQSRTV